MINPVLVETVRGGIVDLRHRGAVAVSDADGRLVWSTGDVERPVYPRSAIKLFQALPLVESGAADRYGLNDKQLAFACSSHSAEEGHVSTAEAMLKAAGLGEADLECGAHWPLFSQQALIDFARSGKTPNNLHNNCSGKHAGFLCAACHQGLEPVGYVNAAHEIQRQARAAQEDMTGFPLGDEMGGIDGCSIPAYAFPLRSLAYGFARAATGNRLGVERAKAAKRLMDACMANPWFTAGTERFCTRIMEAGEGRIFAKTGADGAYVAALPGAGLGIALKCDDGSGQAAEIMLASVLLRLLGQDDDLRVRLEPLASRTIRNWKGIEVAEMRPVSA
ncbi:asparaginase [Oricola thermophila]|uniref:Asparaginase n=1 Tax=Oricola thermophila TaxID=2742145 RepID=A0A6N1VCH3_9HYPH|nr:asparaginase [Oricola thermophila]QKV18696.1 asparaginase [Oricola thermophila]